MQKSRWDKYNIINYSKDEIQGGESQIIRKLDEVQVGTYWKTYIFVHYIKFMACL